MKFLVSILLLVGFVGCASAPVKTDKQLVALQILQRLDEFQDLTIDLYNNKQIDKDHAILYSKFILSSAKVVQTLPNNWQATVKASWLELKTNIPLNTMEVKIQVLAFTLDKLIGAL